MSVAQKIKELYEKYKTIVSKDENKRRFLEAVEKVRDIIRKWKYNHSMPVNCPKKNSDVYCVEYPIRRLMELIDEISALLEEYMDVNARVVSSTLLDTIYRIWKS